MDESYPVMYSVCLRVIFEGVDYHLRLNNSQVVARKRIKGKKRMLGEGQVNMGWY